MEISEIVVKLCQEGRIHQQSENFTELKSILQKNSKLEAVRIIEVFVEKLNQPDVQVRNSVFRAAHLFFLKSRLFREVCSSRLKDLLEYSLTFQPFSPDDNALDLKDFIVRCVFKWKQRFGHLYPQVVVLCAFIEGPLNYSFPSTSNRSFYRGLSREQREKLKRNQMRSEQVVQRHKELFNKCQQTSTEGHEALSIVAANKDYKTEWEDVRVISTPSSVQSDEMEVESSGLDLYKVHESSLKKEASVLSLDICIEVDPAMEEVLSEIRRTAEKNLLPQVEEIISACCSVEPSLFIRRNASILQEAVYHKNQLLDLTHQIRELGITCAQRRLHNLPPLDPAQGKVFKKKRKSPGKDPTRAKSGTPGIISMTEEELQTRASDFTMQQTKKSKSLSAECQRTLRPEVGQALLSVAPQLNEAQAQSLLEKDLWGHNSRKEQPTSHQLSEESPRTLLTDPKLSVREIDRLYNETVISGRASGGDPLPITFFQEKRKARCEMSKEAKKLKRIVFGK